MKKTITIIVCALLALMPTAVYADENMTEDNAVESSFTEDVITEESAEEPAVADVPAAEETATEEGAEGKEDQSAERTDETSETPEAPSDDSQVQPPEAGSVTEPSQDTPETPANIAGAAKRIKSAIERRAEEVSLGDLGISKSQEEELMTALEEAEAIDISINEFGFVSEGGIIQSFWAVYDEKGDEDDASNVEIVSTPASPGENDSVSGEGRISGPPADDQIIITAPEPTVPEAEEAEAEKITEAGNTNTEPRKGTIPLLLGDIVAVFAAAWELMKGGAIL